MGIHGVKRRDGPPEGFKPVRKYTCDACHDTDCECFTEGNFPPTHCCMNYIPKWKLFKDGEWQDVVG